MGRPDDPLKALYGTRFTVRVTNRVPSTNDPVGVRETSEGVWTQLRDTGDGRETGGKGVESVSYPVKSHTGVLGCPRGPDRG